MEKRNYLKLAVIGALALCSVCVVAMAGVVALDDDQRKTETPESGTIKNISTIVASTAYAASTHTMEAMPPTSTLTPTPEILDTPTLPFTATIAPTNTVFVVSPLPTSPPVAACDCSGDLYNCGDFSSHAQALACFNSCKPGDIHRLDQDNDGDPCESLP